MSHRRERRVDGLPHGRGYVFWSDDGRPYLVRCTWCGRENYAPAVSSGQCAFCGHQEETLPPVEDTP